jgi:hypothetical protein
MGTVDPAYAIQAGVFAQLTTWSDMIAAFGGTPRIYDTVPLDPSGDIDTGKFPYCTIGDDQGLGRTPELVATNVTETMVMVDCWSRPQASMDNGEVKTIAAAVRAALDQGIALTGHTVITHSFESSMIRREPDGLTRRARLTFRYLTLPNPNIALTP